MSIVACFLYGLSVQEASYRVYAYSSAIDITTVHSDCLILASYVRWPEIQPLVSRGQIVSADLPLLTDGRTNIILV